MISKFFKKISDKYYLIVSIVLTFLLAFIYGFISHKSQLFPFSFIEKAAEGYTQIKYQFNPESQWFYTETYHKRVVPTYDKENSNNGLTLITSIDANNQLTAKVINMQGVVQHKWNLDWFKIWPDAKHIDSDKMPKSRPGTLIHGIVLLDNGDIIFNFEYLGLVRISKNNEIIWKLPLNSHHSVFKTKDSLWVSGVNFHDKPLKGYPGLIAPFDESTLLNISYEGKVLKEISVFDILKQNGFLGLLYTQKDFTSFATATGDILHLNDVEVLTKNKKEGFFKHGDILFSLRNINTIIVIDPQTLKIKYISTGEFIGLHDPDFIDGNAISIFNNANVGLEDTNNKSSIVTKHFENGIISTRIAYESDEKSSFYSRLMGKHQWLTNGNLLITESNRGRVFEVNEDGKIVWQYINLVQEGYSGVVTEAIRLDKKYDTLFVSE